MTEHARRPRTFRWRIAVLISLIIAGLAALYLVHLALLFLGAHEGDVPSANLIPESPVGVQPISEGKECGSGGCWWQVVLRPAQGQSPEDLAARMGVAKEQKLSGSVFDPRNVTLGSTTVGNELRIYVSY